jgi:hypothetical protein
MERQHIGASNVGMFVRQPGTRHAAIKANNLAVSRGVARVVELPALQGTWGLKGCSKHQQSPVNQLGLLPTQREPRLDLRPLNSLPGTEGSGRPC